MFHRKEGAQDAQATEVWNVKLDDMLVSLGFSISMSKYTIYIRRNVDTQQVVGVCTSMIW